MVLYVRKGKVVLTTQEKQYMDKRKGAIHSIEVYVRVSKNIPVAEQDEVAKGLAKDIIAKHSKAIADARIDTKYPEADGFVNNEGEFIRVTFS